MKKCVLCKENETEEEYSYEEYLNEIHKEGHKCYCRECKEKIRIQKRHEKIGQALNKVKVDIYESDYYLEGFEWSDKKNCWVRPKEDNKDDEGV